MMYPRVVIYPFGDRTFTSTLYYGADVRTSLRGLPAESVHCVMAGPPYWGLRSYLREGDPQKVHEIGMETTADRFIVELVEVFREVRRVLRNDGVLWLNLGDSFARDGATLPGVKPKDLMGTPWRVALAMQEDGWHLRSDIIWAKGNPKPDPATDRPTPSHEYVFLLSKRSVYYYDAHAIREPFADARQGRDGSPRARVRNVGGRTDGFTKPNGIDPSHNGGRNKRSVWHINPQPYRGAHFATMPPKLVELCIKAGSSQKGCCPTCGAPWRRCCEDQPPSDIGSKRSRRVLPTAKWGPTCNCPEHEPIPCVVLDPFSGSGTTGYVANRLGRDYIGTDLNLEYLTLAESRLLGIDPPEDVVPETDASETASIMSMMSEVSDE